MFGSTTANYIRLLRSNICAIDTTNVQLQHWISLIWPWFFLNHVLIFLVILQRSFVHKCVHRAQGTYWGNRFAKKVVENRRRKRSERQGKQKKDESPQWTLSLAQQPMKKRCIVRFRVRELREESDFLSDSGREFHPLYSVWQWYTCSFHKCYHLSPAGTLDWHYLLS